MAKVCPRCLGRFQTDDQVCPVDGDRLIVVDDEQALVGKDIDGKFTLRTILGMGGMGAVYRAWQHSLDRDIAVKLLRRSCARDAVAVQRFLREARAVSRLQHPNTVRIFDFGQTGDGLLYLAMELLQGRTLAQIIDEDGALAVPRAARIMVQICDSLSEAHGQGIVHRDLKPDNIFVCPVPGNPEFVKVVDFGILKSVFSDDTGLTDSGILCGTPRYMSPEHAAGGVLDQRSDVYSLGVLFYEMITGKPPFEADSATALLMMHIDVAPSPPSGRRPGGVVPRAVDDLVMATLSKAPEHRPQSTQELRSRLIEAVGGHAALAAGERQIDTHERTRWAAFRTVPTLVAPSEFHRAATRRRRALMAVGLAVLALLGAGAAVWTWLGPEETVSSVMLRSADDGMAHRLPRRLSEASSTVAAALGDVVLHSAPEGAAVFLDGKPAGNTPFHAAAAAGGKVRILLRMVGYEDEEFDLPLDSPGPVHVPLKPASEGKAAGRKKLKMF